MFAGTAPPTRVAAPLSLLVMWQRVSTERKLLDAVDKGAPSALAPPATSEMCRRRLSLGNAVGGSAQPERSAPIERPSFDCRRMCPRYRSFSRPGSPGMVVGEPQGNRRCSSACTTGVVSGAGGGRWALPVVSFVESGRAGRRGEVEAVGLPHNPQLKRTRRTVVGFVLAPRPRRLARRYAARKARGCLRSR